MAIRFANATSAQNLSMTSFFNTTVFTVMFWTMIRVDRNDYSAYFTISGGGNAAIGTKSDGTSLSLQSDSVESSGVDTPLNTWAHVCWVYRSSTDSELWYNGALQVDAFNYGSDVPATPSGLRLGSYNTGAQYGSEARISALKIWEVALSAGQIPNEMLTYVPRYLTSNWGWWPLFPGSAERLRDYSGHGHDWTANGTVSDEDPPPVTWDVRYFSIPRLPSGTQTSDNQPAYLKGQDSASDNQPAYLKGQDSGSDNQPAYLKGQDASSDNQPSYLKGQDTGSDNQPAYLGGQIVVSSGQLAYMAAQDTGLDNQPAYVHGQDAAADNQPAYARGQDTASDNQSAYLGGQESASDNQPAYTKGQDTGSDNQPSYLKGQDSATDNQPAYMGGQVQVSGGQPAYAHGVDSASSNQPVWLAGESAGTGIDNQPVYLRGQDSSADNQPVYLKGQAVGSANQAAFARGQDSASANQPVYLRGQLGATADRDAWIAGQAIIFANQPAYVRGQLSASAGRSAWISGGVGSSAQSHIGAYLSGVYPGGVPTLCPPVTPNWELLSITSDLSPLFAGWESPNVVDDDFAP